VEDVGAHDAPRHEAEQEDQEERDQRAAAGRGHTEHEADEDADHHGGDLVPAVEREGLALALLEALDEQRAPERHDAGEEDRRRQHADQDRVEPLPGRVLERQQRVHAADRRWHRPERHPREIERPTVPCRRCRQPPTVFVTAA
jgi:hypothetical protein